MEKEKMLVVFVSGPFMGKSHWDVQCNVHRARCAGLEVAKMGCYPFMPHANTSYFYGELTEKHWLAGCLEMLKRSDAMLVLPGWQCSSGTKSEIAHAQEWDKPIFYSLRALWLCVKDVAEQLGLPVPKEPMIELVGLEAL